jgi:hypothetical protein
MRVMPARFPRKGAAAMLCAAWVVTGCSGDPEECVQPQEQSFFLTVTEGLPSGGDPEADIVLDTEAVFVKVDRFPGAEPPQDEYLFRYEGKNLVIVVPELTFPIPVEPDSTYRVTLEITQRLTPAAYGLRVSDGEGVRYLAVTDWRPLSRIFENGYGDLAPDRRLRVFLSDGGCDPVEENSTCFLRRVNQQLEVLIGDGRSRLWHTQTAVLEGFAVRVHKAMIVEAKQGSGCEDAVREQNGVSFSVVRADLR